MTNSTMDVLPLDLPTLRNHYNHFQINNKQIPILYRLKSGVYYPYVAFTLVVQELAPYSPTWNSSTKLPLLPMTMNERALYQRLCPTVDFSTACELLLCSLIDQFLQLFDFLKETGPASDKRFARLTIDIDVGAIPEIDICNSKATAKYDHLRSSLFPSLQTVKRQLSFEKDDEFELSSIGGYLQLDRCIYPYILSSSDILLNLNDLRQPFNSSLDLLMPLFRVQPLPVVENYLKIVEYGTRYIKKYKYYSSNIVDQFISLHQLLFSHRSFFFVQLFDSTRTSLVNLHEYYRADFSHLLAKHLSHCGYVDQQPCIHSWSLFSPTSDNDRRRSRLANADEILLIKWLLLYDQREVQVHGQGKDLVLVHQPVEVLKEKMKLLHNEHMRKRASPSA